MCHPWNVGSCSGFWSHSLTEEFCGAQPTPHLISAAGRRWHIASSSAHNLVRGWATLFRVNANFKNKKLSNVISPHASISLLFAWHTPGYKNWLFFRSYFVKTVKRPLERQVQIYQKIVHLMIQHTHLPWKLDNGIGELTITFSALNLLQQKQATLLSSTCWK